MREFLNIIKTSIHYQDLIEIVILTYIIYKLSQFICRTRAIQVLKGLAFLFFAAFFAQVLGLYTINVILRFFFGIWVIAILIVFQPELRRGLARIGQASLFGFSLKDEQMADEIVESVDYLARNQIGALIVLERDTGLGNYIETGIRIEGKVSSELLNAIFQPDSPLHDGAVIISDEQIAAAYCILPLADVEDSRYRYMGTRHRAALGLTEESDALVVVVSEENGAVSVAINGKFTRDLDQSALRKFLKSVFIHGQRRKKRKVSSYRKKGKQPADEKLAV